VDLDNFKPDSSDSNKFGQRIEQGLALDPKSLS
jgi:hypothetical protein